MAENKKSSIGGKSACHLLNIKEPERTAKRLKLSFQRIHATVSQGSQNKQVDASLTLIDISETGVGVFTEKLLSKGSTVELCVAEPKPIQVKAVVAWSVPVASGILMRRYPFRSGLQFLFESEAQRAALLEFIQRAKLSTSEAVKQEPSPAEAAPASAETTPAEVPAAEAAATETPAAEAPAETPSGASESGDDSGSKAA